MFALNKLIPRALPCLKAELYVCQRKQFVKDQSDFELYSISCCNYNTCADILSCSKNTSFIVPEAEQKQL